MTQRTHWILASLIFLGIVGAIALVVYVKQKAPTSYDNRDFGLAFQIPKSYIQTPAVAEDNTTQASTVVAKFSRKSPPAVITIKYESGLRIATTLLHRSLIEHFFSEIQQFFPVKYGTSYKSDSLDKITVAGKDAVEHTFHFFGNQNMVEKNRLVIVPWDDNSAYYFILQSRDLDFKKVSKDLNVLVQSVKLSGPAQVKNN